VYPHGTAADFSACTRARARTPIAQNANKPSTPPCQPESVSYSSSQPGLPIFCMHSREQSTYRCKRDRSTGRSQPQAPSKPAPVPHPLEWAPVIGQPQTPKYAMNLLCVSPELVFGRYVRPFYTQALRCLLRIGKLGDYYAIRSMLWPPHRERMMHRRPLCSLRCTFLLKEREICHPEHVRCRRSLQLAFVLQPVRER
jgi:hypothetical protein